MESESVVERRPGLIVTACGIGVSTLTLYLVHLLAESGFNAMGFYLNFVIPIGAILVGACSGLGYAFSSRYLQIKLEKRYIWSMLLTGLITYWCALFVTYSDFIERARINPDAYTFVDYVRDSCEQMTFNEKKAGQQAKPLGGWGYLFKALEMAGFIGGAMCPAMMVGAMPYCRNCQKYLRSHLHGYVHTEDKWPDIKRQSKKLRGEALERAVASIGTRSAEEIEILNTGTLAEVEQLLKTFAPGVDKTAAARLHYAVEKCPTCDGHLVKLSLENYAADGTVNTNLLATIDKIEPRQASV